MNICIFVVLVFLFEADCRPSGQDVLAGEDFLAVFMRNNRPRAYFHKVTTQATTEQTKSTADTEPSPTTLETEPPRVVSVRVSSSVRKEAVAHEPVHEAVSAAAQRSHFSVESSGYREASDRHEDDSVAEASQQQGFKEEDKPYAEALTLQESGIHYESRVSSETSQSRIYFSQPKPSGQTVIAQPSVDRKYQPQLVVPQHREQPKYEPQIVTQTFTQNHVDRKYGPEIVVTQQESKSEPQDIYSQAGRDTRTNAGQPFEQTSKFEPELIVTREETKYGPEIVVTQTQSESKYIPGIYGSQSQAGSQPISHSQQDISPQTIISQTQETRKYINQNREQRQFAPQADESRLEDTNFGTGSNQQVDYKSQASTPREERDYEQQEENYEVDEAISVMTNGRAHGVQTESPANNKFGYVQEGRDYRKYRVEEKTPDGFIVGEYGVVNHDGGGIRGVRYTADGSISPRLIYEALVKFLSLK